METLRKFVDEEGIQFPLVADTGKEIKKSYGGGRVTYLIDKGGKIRFFQKGVPNNADLIKRLKTLQ